MHKDLKILFWLVLSTVMIFAIYTLVDWSFQALDKISTSTYYKTVRTSYTDQATDQDPDTPPDRNWKPRKEPLPFLGYAHASVVYIITGIILIAILGFLVIYLAYRKGDL